MSNDPIKRFSEWFEAAHTRLGEIPSTTMALATTTKEGTPSVRMVLLKAYDEHGFVFYTNNESRKGVEIKANPNVALCFHWRELEHQVRIEGVAHAVSDTEADAYFARRPFISRISAIASAQSRPLASREEFLANVKALEVKYGEKQNPPRPHHWSGWRVTPSLIEFWSEGKHRLHERELFTRDGKGWHVQRLYP